MGGRRYILSRVVLLGMGLALFASPVWAEVVLDGSLGPAGPLAGPNYAITPDWGRQLGGNLFHSFAEFNLAAGESATFSGPETVTNIVARVTGGLISSIDGQLTSTIPNADFFLLNPAGIVFGPHASVDVSGSFHVTSADYLQLGEGGRFAVAPGAGSVLTAAPASAFGFVSAAPAGITFAGSGSVAAAAVGIAGVTNTTGNTVSVVAGDLVLESGIFQGQEVGARIISSGKINLVSVGSPGELPLVSSDTAGFSRLGDISLRGNAVVAAFASGGGDIVIRGRALTLDNSQIMDLTTGSTIASSPAGVVDIGLRGAFLLGNNGSLSALTMNAAAGAAMQVRAEEVTLVGGGTIQARATANGKLGDIDIQANGAVSLSGMGAQLPSGIYLLPSATSDSGRLAISAHSLRVADSAWLYGASNTPNPWGKAGAIELDLTTLELAAGGKILAMVSGAGEGTPVTIRAKESCLITGNNSYIDGGTKSGSSGKQGDIVLVADRINLAAGGAIKLGVAGAGQGGSLKLEARELTIGAESLITGDTSEGATGGGADIFFTVGESLRLSGGGLIGKNHHGSGREGDIVLAVDAGRIEIAGAYSNINVNSGIYNIVWGSGAGGKTQIVAKQIDLTASGLILANAGQGGELSVVATDSLFISGQQGSHNASGIYADKNGNRGHPGKIGIQAATLTIADQGKISGDTNGDASGVDIDLHVEVLMLTDGIISAGTAGSGKGGNIAIQADRSVLVAGESGWLGTMSGWGTGDAGNIAVTTPWLLLVDGGRLEAGTLGAGRGGDIDVTAALIEVGERGGISSNNSGLGRGGDILLTTDRLTMEKGGFVSSSSVSLADGGKTGDSGTIIILAKDAVSLLGDRNFASTRDYTYISTGTMSSGHGGQLLVNTPELLVSGKAKINAGSFGAGEAGFLRIEVDHLSLTAGGQLNVTSDGAGRAGDIQVSARQAIVISGYNYLQDGTQYLSGIQARAKSSGNAGNITVNANTLTLADQARITTSALNSTGGNIAINVSRMLHLDHGAISTAVQGGDGNGGNIEIDPEYVLLDHGRISADAHGGNGGNIHLVADNYLADPASQVTASSALAISGEIRIDSPESDVASAVTVLPDSFRRDSALSQNRCAARSAENASSLVYTGKNGILPGEW